MNFLALHDDVKFIISAHLASDLKIRAMLSKNHILMHACMYRRMYACNGFQAQIIVTYW